MLNIFRILHPSSVSVFYYLNHKKRKVAVKMYKTKNLIQLKSRTAFIINTHTYKQTNTTKAIIHISLFKSRLAVITNYTELNLISCASLKP